MMGLCFSPPTSGSVVMSSAVGLLTREDGIRRIRGDLCGCTGPCESTGQEVSAVIGYQAQVRQEYPPLDLQCGQTIAP